MVTRKPVAAAQVSQASNNPPYPTSPTMQSNDFSQHHLNDDGFVRRSRSNSVSSHGSNDSHDTWNSGFSEEDDANPPNQPPVALRAGPQSLDHGDSSHLPNSLRPGPPAGATYPAQQSTQLEQPNPWASEELQGQESAPQPLQPHNPHNPYLRVQTTGQNSYNSQAAWGDQPVAPQQPPPPPPMVAPPAPPVELPAVRTPTDQMASMSLDGQVASNKSAYSLPQGLQPALLPQKTGPRTPSIERQHSGASSNPWQNDIDREEERRRQDDSVPHAPAIDAPPAPRMSPVPQPYRAPPTPPALPSYQPSPHYSTEHIQSEPPALPSLPTYEAMQVPDLSEHNPSSQNASQGQEPRQVNLMDEEPPAQPPRPMEEAAPPKPPRPVPIDTAASTARSPSGNQPDTPNTRAKRQRNETYQIKQINWFDAAAGPTGKMRRSPIMTQNANGPCPLLALVNALTLSTSEQSQTALVDALKSREQVSLGLLLDAVFEELARRSEIHDKELPDVGDLYSFLITLHTGMNVNPRFVLPGAPHIGSVEAEVSMNHMSSKPGVFEETREMVLYSTFGIPLIHGWIPPPDSPEYAAFERSAKTFDDALNIQFREQELEDKLETTGLSPEEQQLYEDIALIKQYLDSYPTQLTEHGLQVMSQSLIPGQIAILFRNDHFSTLYKDPRTGALTTLVTDAGYSSHDEIVWETLVDVNGAASELFSGDFRPVGNSSSSAPRAIPTSDNQDWETVPSRSGNNSNTQASGSTHGTTFAPPPGPPPGYNADSRAIHNTLDGTGDQPKTTEQEDHDMALALQLQEEEEDNERREAAARRQREDELSRQFLDREGHTERRRSSPSDTPANRPQIPPRRSNLSPPNRNSAASPSVDAPYLQPQESPDDQPPSYEQAASDRPFRPPGSQPRNSGGRQGDALGALNAITAQQRAQNMNTGLAPNSAYAANSLSNMSVNSYGVHQATSPGGGPRRRSSGFGGRGDAAGNRVRRTQSQSVAGSSVGGVAAAPPVYGDRMGGNYNAHLSNTAAPGNRVSDQDQEKCVVM